MSGLVVADDVTGPGMDVGSSRAVLASFREPHSDQPLIDLYNAYGANMAVPLAPIYAHSLRFDENLPLYGWLEDVDFSRQLAPYGCIVKNRRMVGVHLGVKIGRVSGFRFGYSQIANPLYLCRKGPTALILRCIRWLEICLLISPKLFGRSLGPTGADECLVTCSAFAICFVGACIQGESSISIEVLGWQMR